MFCCVLSLPHVAFVGLSSRFFQHDNFPLQTPSKAVPEWMAKSTVQQEEADLLPTEDRAVASVTTQRDRKGGSLLVRSVTVSWLV